jgi:outer membrane protein assembly factor BamB
VGRDHSRVQERLLARWKKYPVRKRHPFSLLLPVTILAVLLQPRPVAMAAVGMPNGPGDWPQARYSPAHRGVNPFETILSPSTVGGLHQIWANDLSDQVLFGAPSVASGVVYLGTFDGVLRAMDAATGSSLWDSQLDGGLEDAPAVVNGRVYVHSSAGTAYALDAATGSVVWTATVGHAVSPLTVVHGTVYANGYDAPQFTGRLFALEAATGAELWSTLLVSLTNSAPTVAGGRVFVADESGTVQAFDATTGVQLWVHNLNPREVFQLSTPAAAGRSLFVGSVARSSVYALDQATGATLWTALLQRGDHMDSSPAVANGVVYIGGYRNTYALDARTGAVIWTARGVAAYGLGVAYANGVLYVASDSLYALEAATGSTLFQATFDPLYSYSSPVVANGTVVVGADPTYSGPGVLYAFGL